MGVNFLHLNQRNQRNQILFQYLRDKKKKRKKGAQKKGDENSPISPPLDLRLFYHTSSDIERNTVTQTLGGLTISTFLCF